VLLLMDHSLDFIELFAAAGIIESVTASVKSLAGYDPAELRGRHFEEFLHPQDCARAAEAFAHVLEGEPCEQIMLRYRRKDGSWRTVHVSARSFLDDPGVRAIVVFTRDVTEQIEAENSLAQAHADLRRLSRDLLLAQETERLRIASELRDDVQQILVGLRLSMEAALRGVTQHAENVSISTWIVHVQEVIEHLQVLTGKLRVGSPGEHELRTELRRYVEEPAPPTRR
jgi:PAS domain S-box-containing protein